MKFSIIMATHNAEKFLPRAFASIFSQTYPGYEIIVQDGGSSDGTLDILKKYGAVLNWRSEPDSGVYDAWNRAVERATGDWCIFLGADDCLMGKEVLARCRHHLRRMPKEILFAYGALVYGADGVVDHLENRSLLEVYRYFAADLGLTTGSVFMRLPLVKKYKFDTSYKIAGDYDFIARFFRHDNIARMPVVVSYMERDGLSSNAKTKCLLLDERGKVLHKRVLPKAQEIVLGCLQHYWHNDKFLEQMED